MKNKYYILSSEKRFKDVNPIEFSDWLNDSAQNPHDLKIIDKFTCKFIDEMQMKTFLLKNDRIDVAELDNSIEIYYFDNKLRKFTEGICFADDIKYLNPDNLNKILIDLKNNKQVLNHIKNKFNGKSIYQSYSTAFKIFIEHLFDLTNNDFNCLNLLNYLSYNELRSIGLYIKYEIEKIEKVEEMTEVLDLSDDNIKQYLKKPNITNESTQTAA